MSAPMSKSLCSSPQFLISSYASYSLFYHRSLYPPWYFFSN
jgi:hypothetical protein